MSKSKRALIKTIEILNKVIEEKDRMIKIQDEENNDLRLQLMYYIEKPYNKMQPLFTWKEPKKDV